MQVVSGVDESRPPSEYGRARVAIEMSKREAIQLRLLLHWLLSETSLEGWPASFIPRNEYGYRTTLQLLHDELAPHADGGDIVRGTDDR